MTEVIATLAWVMVGILCLLLIQKHIPKSDSRYVWGCFWAHIASAFILIWLVREVLGGGDIDMYYFYGDGLSEFIRRDPGRWLPEVFLLILQMDADMPMRLYTAEGSSTSSMIGITAVILVISGGSQYGTAIFFTLLAFSGHVGLYFGFRKHFPEAYHTRFLIAVLLVPSVVFWTSGVVKEAVAMGGMGWMIWGFHRWIVDKEHLLSALMIFVGGVVVSISKAYVLFPMVIAGGAWWFWHHSLATSGSVAIASKPLYMVGAALVAMVGVVGLGELFPEYSVETLGEEAAQMQQAGAGAGGGSYYAIGNPDETSLTGQLAFAPMALMASFFRPLIFEAHNLVAFINSLEMTAVLLLWIRIIWVRGVRGSWRLLSSSPALVFCAVFAILCGLGVGLTTTNLGTLSRYRVPMMPMYFLLLLMLLPLKRGGTEVGHPQS